MIRTIEITVPSDQTDDLVAGMRELKGILGLRVQRGISLQPPGDVVAADVTNRELPDLLRWLDQQGVGQGPRSSITTSEPTAYISSTSAPSISGSVQEVAWEEMETTIAKESKMTLNLLFVMAVAGLLATVGLATGTLHYVIAAMVIAPGFEPFVRISLGMVLRGEAWRRGLLDVAKGYVALVLGAAGTALALRALGTPLTGQGGSYLPSSSLVIYWSTISPTAVLVSAIAGAAGAVLIAAHRSVLTAGVMIALALIPTAALVGLALVAGDPVLAARGLLRWGVDAALVVAASALVFAWKQSSVHRRRMLL